MAVNISTWKPILIAFDISMWLEKKVSIYGKAYFYYVRKCVTKINILLLENENYKTGISNLFFNELIEAMNRGYLNKKDLEISKTGMKNFHSQ